eukprot:1827071-Pleurochrysis_carterae.AAC.1
MKRTSVESNREARNLGDILEQQVHDMWATAGSCDPQIAFFDDSPCRLHDTARISAHLYNAQRTYLVHTLDDNLGDRLSVLVVVAREVLCAQEANAPCGADEHVHQMIALHVVPAVDADGAFVGERSGANLGAARSRTAACNCRLRAHLLFNCKNMQKYNELKLGTEVGVHVAHTSEAHASDVHTCKALPSQQL